MKTKNKPFFCVKPHNAPVVCFFPSYFSMQIIFGWLAAIANIAGFAMYFHAMRNTSSTSTMGWFLSAVLALSAAVAQFTVSESFAGSASYFFGAACCAGIFLFSTKSGLSIVRADKLTAVVALVIAVLAFLLPAWSIYLLCAYYLLTYSVFFRAIAAGTQEPVHPWLVWCTSAILQLMGLALNAVPVQSYILPLTNLLCWSGVVVLVTVARRSTALASKK